MLKIKAALSPKTPALAAPLVQVGVRPPLDQHQQILARRLVLVLVVAALLVRWYPVLALAALLLRLRLVARRRQVAER